MDRAAITNRAALLAAAIMVAGVASARAEEPHCRAELPSVQREASEAPLTREKQTQVKALLEQAERACKANNDVVAMAGIDQARAVISAERRAGTSED
jgi:hypothetical protein